MANYYFEVKQSNFKKRNQYWSNKSLIKLVNIMLSLKNRKKFTIRVSELFSINTIEELEYYDKSNECLYNDINDLKTYKQIIRCFKSFIQLKKSDKLNIKGTYVELLFHEIVCERYPDKQIERECHICSDNFRSLKTVDIAVSCNPNTFSANECKYSYKVFSERDLDNLVNIKNQFKNSYVNLVLIDDKNTAKKDIKTKFKKLKNINKKLNKVNIIYLVDF